MTRKWTPSPATERKFAVYEARRIRILEAVTAGSSIMKVAADEGISRQRVSQIIHRHGLRIDRRHYERQAAISRRNRAEVERRFSAGESVTTIAAALGLTPKTVGVYLRALGHDRRPAPSAHGTTGRYDNYDCRCEPCRAANKERTKRYRNPAKSLAWARAYRRRHPDRDRAWHAVDAAVRSGVLVRPERCPCGRDARVHGHHDDYSRPLDVLWLCAVCHKARHERLRQQKAAA